MNTSSRFALCLWLLSPLLALSLTACGTVSHTAQFQEGFSRGPLRQIEVGNVENYNAIVVGGPCANAVAAELMGNPEKCWEAIPENKALIKLYEHANGNVALLVAGRTALDTRRACRVLANYEDYALSGTEVEVSGTSLSDIQVSGVA